MGKLDETDFLRQIAHTLVGLERRESIQRDPIARQDLWVLRRRVEDRLRRVAGGLYPAASKNAQ